MTRDDFIFRSFCSVLILTNVLGNFLVILVILKRRSMKTPINYLLLNLAVADLMVGVFLVPLFILHGTFFHPQGIGGDVLCKLLTSGNFAWISLYSSVFSLVFIAVERYYAIMRPLSIRHRITTRKLKIFIPICWTLSAVLISPHFYFAHFDEKLESCRYAWPTWISKPYYFLYFFLAGIFPTSIMAVLYSRVIHGLWFNHNVEINGMLQAVRRSRKKVTKTMLMLSVIYVLCWFPDPVLHVLDIFFPNQISYSTLFHNALRLLIVLNSTVNPIVYAFQFEEFRKGLRKIFCCERRSNRIHVTQRDMEDTGRVELELIQTVEIK